VSSFQLNPLPEGYLLRLATEQDLIRILYFEFFTHDTSSMGRVLLLCLLCIALSFALEARMIIILMFVFGLILLLSLLIPAYRRAVRIFNEGTSSFWIVHRRDVLCGYICYENIDGHNIISRLLISNTCRNRGIGSNLLCHCICSIEKPIYLTPLSKLKTFYYRFGFVDVSFADAPVEISRRLKNRNANLMILPETST
jgi:N-acetylglutamate synthase-like GNAT family acetyltransferase